MHRLPRGTARLLLASSILLLTLVSGCSSPAVVLWTDRSDVAPVVELFNAAQEDFVVELVFQTDVSRALRLSETPADVVLAGAIKDGSTARMFRPLDRLLKDSIDPDDFYSSLRQNGVRSGRQHLLPVSFNLPLIYSSGPLPVGTITMMPEEMRLVARTFAEIEEGEAVRLAFSPLWDRSFLYEMVRLGGLQGREAADGTPEWSLDSLLAGINMARDWVREDNGGYEVDAAFQDKYLYEPQIRLVRTGRTFFGFDRSDTFFRRSDLARRGLQFRWLGREGQVPVLEGIVYAGVPARAKNRSGAEAFLSWLFTPEAQRQLLENNRSKRIDSFGLIGGFSSLWRVTERFIPENYPSLDLVIPPADWLDFPSPAPRHWASVVVEVVEPWLLREAAGIAQSRDLAMSIRAWLLQQEE